ncbi:Pr6Pr family membrane protein [Penaeicola halotolerans]|uniref:Pr6Pr family membrane protein n=1 Tax=Penaeicola halotolerans TaxID=2793196 RepID=UPI001CF8CF10|nr:Pr6Pr family membrane protein [Penaeicola halotolerans]
MRRTIDITLFLVCWATVIGQLILMIINRQTDLLETMVRFFSFFTILTNSLVAIYFTVRVVEKPIFLRSLLNKAGSLTAITVYILVVGMVYQVLLRSLWTPVGMQRLVDELLHTFIPAFMLFYWFFFENKAVLKFSMIGKWLLYPLTYLVFILVRGAFSDFYPYPFVQVNELGYQQVLINSFFVAVFFIFLSGLLIQIAKISAKIPKQV